MTMMPKIFCKNVGCEEDGDCWVMCAKDDPGAEVFNLERPLDVPALLDIMAFVCWYEYVHPTARWGGVDIADALKALQLVLHTPDQVFADLKAVVLGNRPKDN